VFLLTKDTKGAFATQMNQASGATMRHLAPIKSMLIKKPMSLAKSFNRNMKSSSGDRKVNSLTKSWNREVGDKTGKAREKAKDEWANKWEKQINQVHRQSEMKNKMTKHVTEKWNKEKDENK
jgi:hypothetical protein